MSPLDERSTVSELLSADQAKQNYPLLRRIAGEVLQPGPWRHRLTEVYDGDVLTHLGPCRKCGRDTEDSRYYYREPCPSPDPAEGPIEVIAEQVVECTCHIETDMALYRAICSYLERYEPYLIGYWQRFATAPAPLRAAISLLALDKVRCSNADLAEELTKENTDA